MKKKQLKKVISEIPKFVKEIIVVNNRSTDQTIKVVKKQGVTVLTEIIKDMVMLALKALHMSIN